MLLLLAACVGPAPVSGQPSTVDFADVAPAGTIAEDADALGVDHTSGGGTDTVTDPPETGGPVPIPSACPEAITVPIDPRATTAPVGADPHADVFGEAAEPTALRVQWPGDPSESVAFIWRTDDATRASAVVVGTAEDGSATLTGGSFPLSTDPLDGRVHEVHVCGLVPGTSYTWRVGGEGHWSADRTHTTAPLPGTVRAFRFGVAGDSRGGYGTWASVASGLASHGVAFRMLTGDAVANGADVGEWDDWLAAGVGAEDAAPTVMANGNHENLAYPFLALNALPGNERTFSFDYGNAHFVVLNDSVVTGDEWSQQAAWLAADLAATSQPWRLVFHHKPAYTASNHEPDADVRSWFVPVEEAGGVAVDFAGHNHNYERSAPLRDGVEMPSELGTTYVVTAGAGAPLYENLGNQEYMRVGEVVNHYVVVTVDGSDLELVAYDLSGNVIDRCTTTRR